MASGERFWVSRARWRLRGATMWPAFVALTLIEGLVIHLLPPLSIELDIVGAVLVATFGNLFLVAVVVPLLAGRLAANRPLVQRELLHDRIGTAVLAAGLVGLVAAGLGSRPLIVSETEATERNAEAVSRFIAHTGDPELQRNLETANTVKLQDGYFRTCIARDDRRRYFCMYVDTNRRPTDVRLDRSTESNSELFPNGTPR